MSYDLVIVGARCAGAATALLLARQGARVLLLDRSRDGTDALSTHALTRGAVLQLHRWGLLPGIVAAGTPRIPSATFHLPGGATTADIKARDGVDALYAPRRTVLDPLLADAARRAGADVRFGVSVSRGMPARPGQSDGTTHSAGTLTTMASWVDRAMTTTASVSGDGFSSRCGTCGGTRT